MKNIVLIGLMGTFKSSSGKKVAAKLKMPFLDTDALIEKKEGVAISEIFSEKGEGYFRELESILSLELAKTDSAVIATGGGFALNSQNILNLKKNSIIVWLWANPATVFSRIKKSARPFILNGGTEEQLADILEKRTPLYARYCDIKIDNSLKGSRETSREIIRKVNKLALKDNPK